MSCTTDPFPIYRESNNKFYVPRMFGIANFGIPNEMRISEGDPIDIKFNGKLLDTPERNQVSVVNKFMDHINNGNCGGLLDLYAGFGKLLLDYILSCYLK